MALFNVSVWQRSRFVSQCFIINLCVSLAWLTDVALAQLKWSEGVSGSVSIPDLAFTCLGNLAIFISAFTRGRLDMENGARDVLATIRGPKLNAIDGGGLTTRPLDDLIDIDVVILSKYNERPPCCLTQFLQYIAHSHALESILLQFFPFSSVPVTVEICKKCDLGKDCHCVVFWATEEIMMMLAKRLPGTLKWLSKGQCLLPSLNCLRNGCHGLKRGCLDVVDLHDVEAAGESSELGTSGRRLIKDYPRVHSPAAAVCEALNDYLYEEEETSCICLPVHPWNADRFTKFMIKFLKSKEKEEKGIEVVVSKALEHYIANSVQELGLLYRTLTDCIVGSEIYYSASLILPRVAEVIVNVALTGWLRVDGLSSSLVARRAIRDYVADSTGTGFGANVFLTEAVVFCSGAGTNVCQVLCLRGGILSARRISYIVGFVNLICFIAWSVLIASVGNWTPSMPLSTPRVSVIIVAVGVALGMDCFEVYGGNARARSRARARARAGNRDRVFVQLQLANAERQGRDLAQDRDRDVIRVLRRSGVQTSLWGLVAVVILEVGCIASLVVSLTMNKGLGKWVYSGMQVLVWVKWGIGSFLLGDNATDEDGILYFQIRNRGTWVYCSAFLLNAMVAGVLSKWKYNAI